MKVSCGQHSSCWIQICSPIDKNTYFHPGILNPVPLKDHSSLTAEGRQETERITRKASLVHSPWLRQQSSQGLSPLTAQLSALPVPEPLLNIIISPTCFAPPLFCQPLPCRTGTAPGWFAIHNMELYWSNKRDSLLCPRLGGQQKWAGGYGGNRKQWNLKENNSILRSSHSGKSRYLEYRNQASSWGESKHGCSILRQGKGGVLDPSHPSQGHLS